jgi:hypothetical protein
VKSRSSLLFALLAVGALIIVGGLVTLRMDGEGKPNPADAPNRPQGFNDRTSAANPVPGKAGPDNVKKTLSPLAGRIEGIFASLQDGTITEQDLETLKRYLLAADPAKATAAILDFLASGRDARTGLDFALRPGGDLAAPTMRVLLMDILGRIAQRDKTDAAAKLARETLEKKDSPDEWAIALRNLAWAEPGANAFLSAKVREMLNYEVWRMNPTSGWIEAFDVIVYTRDATFVADLVETQNEENSALSHAAEVALDRLAAANPLDVMTYLNAHPETLSERPMLRADYFAKADLAHPGQKTALEFYLGRPDISDAEKGKLIKALATPADFVSENLLTGMPAAVDDTVRDRILIAATKEWLAGKRFPGLDSQLVNLQRRLSGE